AARRLGHDVEVLDAAGGPARLDAALWARGRKFTTRHARGGARRPAWGRRRPCLDAGVRIYEHTPATSLSGVTAGAGLRVRTPYGSVRAAKVALAPRGAGGAPVAPGRPGV